VSCLPSNNTSCNILLLAIGIPGHLVPLIRLGEALSSRGYAVTVASHERGRDMVEAVEGLQVSK